MNVETTQRAQWEYRAMDSLIAGWFGHDKQLARWMDELNELGTAGWELVSDAVIYTQGAGGTQRPVLLFKRRKS